MFRNQGRYHWRVKAAVYTVAGTASGAALGGVLSWAGRSLSWPRGLLLGAAVCALVLGVVELAGRRIRPLQRDCETPRRWMHKGDLPWAVLNGGALGVGLTSRIGFWLWYAIPLGALAVADPLIGTIAFGLYSLTRTGGAWAIAELSARKPGWRYDSWLFRKHWVARRVAAANLVLVSIVMLGAVAS